MRRHHPRTLTSGALALALALTLTLTGCQSGECTEIGCESSMVVDYGDIVVDEPYLLTINPNGQQVSVVCLSNDPNDEPLPEWLRCNAEGFEIRGEQADSTTITVAVVPLSTGEAAIPNALVALTVDEVNQPNGPDCEPVCYVRSGSVPPTGTGEP